MKTLAKRFWKKVDKRGNDACWEWLGCKSTGGYGKIGLTRALGSTTAHRVAIYLNTGEWPPADKMVCHTCNNRACVNPAHLYIGTHKDNMLDRDTAGRCNPPKGIEHYRSKLNNKKAKAIREIYAIGGITQRQLARLYGVNCKSIHQVLHNITWKHVN